MQDISSNQLGGHQSGASRASSTRKRGAGPFRKGDLRSFVEEHLHLPDHVLHKLQQHQQQLQQQQQRQREEQERGEALFISTII